MNDLPALVEEQRQQFLTVRVDRSMEFDREAAFAVQIIQGSDYLMKVARSKPESLRNAINNVAAFGVTLNPAQKLAYLVPRAGAICLDVSYMGLMHIAQQCGAIQWGQAVIVRAKDTFELQGIDKQPIHKYSPFATDRGEIVGVYCVVKTDGGDYLTHSMPIAKVYDIRDRSEAYKKGSGPWKTDAEEMIKKTCVKQAAKYWPRRDRLDLAVHHLNTDGGEGLSVKPNAMSEDEFITWAGRITDQKTKEKAKEEWRKALAVCEELGDRTTAERLKKVLLDHSAILDQEPQKAAA